MYIIQNATVNDVETIRRIAWETWYDTYLSFISKEQLDYMLGEIYSTEKLSAQIKNNEQTFLLIKEDNETVAFAAYSPKAGDQEIYKLHKIYCLPKTQGKGCGKIFIDTVCNKVAEAGKHILELNVNRYNKAKTFYEKMGFKIMYEVDVPIGPYFMNDYVMRKELK